MVSARKVHRVEPCPTVAVTKERFAFGVRAIAHTAYVFAESVVPDGVAEEDVRESVVDFLYDLLVLADAYRLVSFKLGSKQKLVTVFIAVTGPVKGNATDCPAQQPDVVG